MTPVLEIKDLSTHIQLTRSVVQAVGNIDMHIEQGETLGFGSVFSGPLVRSSYRADEQRHAAATGRGAVAL